MNLKELGGKELYELSKLLHAISCGSMSKKAKTMYYCAQDLQIGFDKSDGSMCVYGDGEDLKINESNQTVELYVRCVVCDESGFESDLQLNEDGECNEHKK